MALPDFALIAQPGTTIGDIVPHVTVEEVYRDEVVTTDHPVELGAAVTDHAFRRPPVFEIRCGWSNSTGGSSAIVMQVYEQLRALQEQARAQPIDVFTPRRMYDNMVMGALQVIRDANSNSIIACSMILRQIIIVEAQTTGGDAAKQADPASTASPGDAGPVSTTPGPGYDFTQINAGNMGDAAAYAGSTPATPFTGVGEQAFAPGYNVGSIQGADPAAYAASAPSAPFTGTGETAFGGSYSVGSIYGADPQAYAGAGIGSSAPTASADMGATAFGSGYTAGTIPGANSAAFSAGGLSGMNEITNTAPDGSAAPVGAPSTVDQRPVFEIVGVAP